jgi:hypothetical protein
MSKVIARKTIIMRKMIMTITILTMTATTTAMNVNPRMTLIIVKAVKARVWIV